MSDTFRNVATVRGYDPELIDGRGKPKQAGHKDTAGSAVRSTYAGRHETFLNDAVKPPTFGKGKLAHKYSK